MVGSEALSTGQAIAHVRCALYRAPHGRYYSQRELYNLCSKLAREAGITARIYFMHVTDQKYAGRKVSQVEMDEARLSPTDLELVARAFELPDAFFRRPYADEAALTAAYEEARRRMPLSDAVLADNGPAEPAVPIAGFRRVSTGGLVLDSTRARAEAINTAIERARPRSALVLIEGRTWVGKSFLTGLWYDEHYAPSYGGHALTIDCGKRSIDQIRPAIEAHFAPLAREACKDTAAYFETEEVSKLIVLDRLRLDQFVEGPPAGGPRRPNLRELVDIIAPFLNRGRNTTVVLVIEVNGPGVEGFVFSRALDAGVVVHSCRLEPLSEEEGAKLLWAQGVRQLSESSRRQISRRAHGLPLAIRAAADELNRLPAVEQEQYVDDVLPRGDGAEVGAAEAFTRYFHDYAARLNPLGASLGEGQGDAGPDQAHPYALLRLLSLMPGEMPIDYLRELLDDQRIERLRAMSIETVLRGDIPFVAVSDTHVHLQSRIARILRSEIEAAIRDDAFDGFSSRAELEWIHWRCAQQSWRLIRSMGQENDVDVDVFSLAAIEAFVHHAMAQIRLIPRQGPGSTRHATSFPGGVSDGLVAEFNRAPGTLTDVQLWMLAYLKVVRPFLLQSKHTATRVHGQYETKARIISALLAEADRGVRITPQDKIELLKEMSVCWMHAGRLNSAHRFIKQAEAALAELAAAGASDGGALQNSATWRLQCDVCSIRMAVDERLGRAADIVTAGVEPLRQAAKAVTLTTERLDGGPEKRTPAQHAGAFRILTRDASALLLQGETETALTLFERVDALHRDVRGRLLDGDAARRYVVALTRTREQSPRQLELAGELVEANIAHYLRQAGTRAGLSTDLIPFLILRAALRRVSGDFDGAEDALSEVEAHAFVSQRKCTYVTIAELQLERLRLQVARGQLGPRVFARGRDLCDQLGYAHHAMMQHEAMVVVAEAAGLADRGGLIDRARNFYRGGGWRLRLADIGELEDGGSAVRRFGL